MDVRLENSRRKRDFSESFSTRACSTCALTFSGTLPGSSIGMLAGNSTGTTAGSSSGGMIPGSSNGVTPGSSTRGETGDCEDARRFDLGGRVKVNDEVELEPADEGMKGHEVLSRSDSSFNTLLASWRLVTAFSCILTRSSDVVFCSVAISRFCTISALISKAIMISCDLAVSGWSVSTSNQYMFEHDTHHRRFEMRFHTVCGPCDISAGSGQGQ